MRLAFAQVVWIYLSHHSSKGPTLGLAENIAHRNPMPHRGQCSARVLIPFLNHLLSSFLLFTSVSCIFINTSVLLLLCYLLYKHNVDFLQAPDPWFHFPQFLEWCFPYASRHNRVLDRKSLTSHPCVFSSVLVPNKCDPVLSMSLDTISEVVIQKNLFYTNWSIWCVFICLFWNFFSLF